MIAFTCFHVVAAARSQDKLLDMRLENVSLEQVIWELERKTDFTFMYWTSEVKQVKVSLNMTQKSVREILDFCLAGTTLRYEVNDETIVIYGSEEPEKKKVVITGVVKDEAGEPLPGVTIVLKGTSVGMATGTDGRFELELPAQDPIVLKASFIGMEDVEVKVTPGKPVNITMKSVVSEIDEVVVNGYFTQNRNSYTGAVSSIKGEDLLKVSKTNLLKALSFSVPGLRIVEDNVNGANPNKVPEIILRGMNSLDSEKMEQGLNRPLIIMDGVEISLEQLYDLDMFDIERIDVLKDASATAMYGEKAANGVIVIERKRVTESRLRVRYNFVPNISFPDVSSFDLCSPWEKLELERLFGVYDSPTGEKDDLYNEKLKRVTAGVNTDWKSKPLRNSWSHAHSLSITGRGSGMDYGITARYSDSRGIMKEDYRRNLGLGFYFSYHLGSKLTVSFRSDFSKLNSKDSPYGNFSEWVRLNPYDVPKDENGEWVKLLSFDLPNPMYDATLSSFSKSESKSFSNSLTVRWDIVKGLYFTGSGNYTLGDSRADAYESPDESQFVLVEDESQKGAYKLNGSKSNSWNLQGVLNYSLSLDEDGTILSLHAGATVTQAGGNSFSFEGRGFSKDRLDDLNFAQGYPEDGKPNGGDSYDASVAYLANVNFIWKNRYFADFSWRTSGSSVISKDRRWSPYWSVGIGWNVHNENLVAGLGWISALRLRGSVGYVGSGNFGGALAQTVYRYGGDVYDNYLGAWTESMGNAKLKSQRTLKWNGGMNLDMFDGRLGVEVDVYKEVSKDLLMDVSLPPSIGYKTAKCNLGESSNHGYELAVSGEIIRGRDWGWTVSANTSHTVNKILKISNALKNANAENRDNVNIRAPKILLEEGKSATAIYAVRSAGIDPVTGKEIFITKDGAYTFTPTPQDKVALGNSLAKLQGSLSTGVRWKNLSVFAGFSYTLGGDIYNSTRAGIVEDIIIQHNVDRRAFSERWKYVNDHVMYAGKHSYKIETERFVERKNELYFSTLDISYDLEGDWLKKIGLRRLSLGIGFSDIGRLSTVKYERGTSYPYMRGYNFTISPTF